MQTESRWLNLLACSLLFCPVFTWIWTVPK